VSWQEIDGPQALAALATSKQSLAKLLQLKDKQAADGEEIARALNEKREESNVLGEGTCTLVLLLLCAGRTRARSSSS
jgi:hypothetical protein